MTPYVIHDPALGRRVVRGNEFSRSFTGIAVEFERTECPRQAGVARQITLRAFLQKVRGARAEVTPILSLALLLELLQILAPFYLQFTIDWAITPGDAEVGTVLVLVFAAALLAQAATAFLRSIALLRLRTELI